MAWTETWNEDSESWDSDTEIWNLIADTVGETATFAMSPSAIGQFVPAAAMGSATFGVTLYPSQTIFQTRTEVIGMPQDAYARTPILMGAVTELPVFTDAVRGGLLSDADLAETHTLTDTVVPISQAVASLEDGCILAESDIAEGTASADSLATLTLAVTPHGNIDGWDFNYGNHTAVWQRPASRS